MNTGYTHPFAAFFDRNGFMASYDRLLPTSGCAPVAATGGTPPHNGGRIIGHSPKAA